MRKLLPILMVGALLTTFASCRPAGTDEPTDPIKQNDSLPESYHRKSLIEEFTGMTCGYCPDGMKHLHNYMHGHENDFVLVLHHVGYESDQLTAVGSSKVISAVAGSSTYAPSMSINRQKLGRISKYASPYDLENYTNYPDTKTYACIELSSTYDAGSKELTVVVNGVVLDSTKTDLELTVLVKESGIHGAQADYNNTYEGWSDFIHCDAVRTFLTNPLGDAIIINNKRYTDTLTTTLKSAWKAENCMVVAYLTETNKHAPVIQAEQIPIVEGTQGGADIQYGGVTRVPVSETYPEPSNGQGPLEIMNTDTVVLTVAQAQYRPYTDYQFNVWYLSGYSSSTYTIAGYNGYTFLPYVDIMLFTAMDVITLPVGTYSFNTQQTIGTAFAGYRDDEVYDIGGSELYLTEKNYFMQGYLVPGAEWLINTGTLEITENGFRVVGNTYCGKPIAIKYNGNISVSRAQAPARSPFAKYDAQDDRSAYQCTEGTYGKRIVR